MFPLSRQQMRFSRSFAQNCYLTSVMCLYFADQLNPLYTLKRAKEKIQTENMKTVLLTLTLSTIFSSTNNYIPDFFDTFQSYSSRSQLGTLKMGALLQTYYPPILPLKVASSDCSGEQKQGCTSMSFLSQLSEVYRVIAVLHLTLLSTVSILFSLTQICHKNGN